MPGGPFGKRRQANLEEKEGNCRRGGLSAAESGLPHYWERWMTRLTSRAS